MKSEEETRTGFACCTQNQGKEIAMGAQVVDVCVLDSDKVVLSLSDGASRQNVLANKTIAERCKALARGDLVEARIISLKNLKDNIRFFMFDFAKMNEKAAAEWSRREGVSSVRRPRHTSTSSELLAKRPEADAKAEFNFIAELRNPDNSFLIKGRVISKEPLRPFKGGGGNLFSVKLRDSSGMIRATFFRSAANRFYEYIQVGRVYTFTGGEVETASRYNNTVIPYEIIFKNDAMVQEVEEDPEIPNKEMSITKLRDIRTIKMNSIVDVLVVVLDPGILEEVNLRSGGTKKMRKIKIIDSSNDIIEICVWGARAEEFDLEKDKTYFIKDIKVKEFQGDRNLLVEEFTEIEENIEMCEEYLQLLLWRSSHKSFLEQYVSEAAVADGAVSPNKAVLPPTKNSQGHYILHSVQAMLDECENFFAQTQNHNRRQFFNLLVHVFSISKKVCYFSCGIRDCKKKISEHNGALYCDKCQKYIKAPKLRFMADLGISDSTGAVYPRIFGNENCIDFFGKNIHEIEEMGAKDEEILHNFLKKHQFREFIIRIMVRKELYEGEERNSYEILRIEPVDRDDVLKKLNLSILGLIGGSK